MSANLRVALVVESSSAGVGRHVMDLAGGLLNRGHEVHLFYSPLRIDQRFTDALEACHNRPNFSATEHCMRRELNAGDLSSAVKIRRSFSSGFDIVHCHSTKAGFVARLGMAGTTTPRVYTPHAPLTMDESRGPLFKGLAAALEFGLAHLSSRVIAVSERERAHLAGIGIAESKLRVVSNGVDAVPQTSGVEQRRKGRRALNLESSDICIGFVGRLESQKNPEMLLRAAAQLPANTHLAMVGAGSREREMRELARALGIAPRVHWLGAANGIDWMPAFDVFALTSRYEGQPYVLLEAMAAGLPLVVTDVGGSELVNDGENGFVVAVDAAGDFARALSAAARLGKSMGAASAERARRYSVAAMVDSTLSVYEEILLGRSSSKRELLCLTSPQIK